ncbi:hypothetical protein EU537_12145, partial [Candidatus Thorarchaeota archaeon]
MKKIITTTIIALMLIGFISTGFFVSAQDPEDPFVYVGWDVENKTEELGHTEQSSQWLFGPQPTIIISYEENGTSITENNYRVEVGTEILINITVPKSFLGEGNILDTLKFWGSTETPGEKAVFALGYNATSDTWEAPYAARFELGSDTPSEAGFIEFIEPDSSYSNSTAFYRVIFAVNFTRTALEGIYWTGMHTIDQLGRPVSPSWLSRLQSGGFATPPIGLSVKVNPADFFLPKYYYGEITNREGEIIHYVDDNDTFIVRLLSHYEFGDVMIPFAYLDLNSSYFQEINYTQPVNWPDSMYNPDAPMENVALNVSPTMFLVHNSTHTVVEAGYPSIEFYWAEITEGIGAWLLNYTMTRNSTIDLSRYYVANSTYTNEFNQGRGIRWGGYFTNNTDMHWHPFKTGAIIDPSEILYFAQVEDINGEQLYPRPEITGKQTMKLSYKESFIEAFLFDNEGNLANKGEQGEYLNLTMFIHRPLELINGSSIYEWQDNTWQVTEELVNGSIQFSGSGYGENETHYWNYAAWYNVTLDFETGSPKVWSLYAKKTYLRGTGEAVGKTETQIAAWLTVHDFSIELGEDVSKLFLNISFSPLAPDMLFERAKMTVGQVENLRIWNGTHFVLPTWLPPEQYADWIDQYKKIDVSNQIVWSPSHFKLGNVQLWVPPAWTVTDDGAIDLDGNTFTTDDQYYVKRTGYWKDWGNISIEGMQVDIIFEPSPDESGDEFFSRSWMGVVEMVMEFEANETFHWYKAETFELVSESEMEDIRETMWADEQANVPKPEYQYTAWMSKNRTIDLSHIPELESGVWRNTWFAWGTSQLFNITTRESQQEWAIFRAEYAGMLIFNDLESEDSPNAPDFSFEETGVESNEVTHLVLIDSVGGLELRRPFDSTADHDSRIVSPDTVIDFGISIYDVNVTIYPLKRENAEGIRSPWELRQSTDGAMGLNQTNFDYAISTATIDEMAFDITFQVDMVEYDAEDEETWNHAASFKIDQIIGNWSLNEFDNSVLNGRGLAVNYFGILATAKRTQYQAGNQPVADTNADSVGANYYVFGDENSPFANVSMGGLPYTWGGDDFTTEYISGSSTAPLGAFSAMFQSQSGQSITNWNIEASMLFMTAGYVNWGGHAVHVDPVFVSYTSAQQTLPPTGTTTTTTTTTTDTTTDTTGPPGDPMDLY